MHGASVKEHDRLTKNMDNKSEQNDLSYLWTVVWNPGRFAPYPVRPVSRFVPIPVRPDSLSLRVVSPSFINSALKNEIWKIPLQIFVFWML